VAGVAVASAVLAVEALVVAVQAETGNKRSLKRIPCLNMCSLLTREPPVPAQ
jgi:hypothetical protein